MYCSKCGNKVQDDWRVCPYCENALRPAVAGISAGDYEVYSTVSPLSDTVRRKYEGKFHQETCSDDDRQRVQKTDGQTERKDTDVKENYENPDRGSTDEKKKTPSPKKYDVVWEGAAGACAFWLKGKKQSFGTVWLYPDRLKWASQKDLQEEEVLYRDISNCEIVSLQAFITVCILLTFFSWIIVCIISSEEAVFLGLGVTLYLVALMIAVLLTHQAVMLTTSSQKKYYLRMKKKKDHQQLHSTLMQCIKDYRKNQSNQ